jgi:hypothetical protein
LLFIATRGKTIDYHFLLRNPESYWWRKYAQLELTDLEEPTLLMEADRDPYHLKIYLNSIPSRHKDEANRTIRYTLVVELVARPDSQQQEQLKNLIQTWLQEVTEAQGNKPNPGESELGKRLDRCFWQWTIERFLQLTLKPDRFSALETTGINQYFEIAIQRFWSQFNRTPQLIPAALTSQEWWWAGAYNPQSSEVWLARIEQILQGEKFGSALLLNAADPASLNSLVAKKKSLAVLLSDPNYGQASIQVLPVATRSTRRVNWISWLTGLQRRFVRLS